MAATAVPLDDCESSSMTLPDAFTRPDYHRAALITIDVQVDAISGLHDTDIDGLVGIGVQCATSEAICASVNNACRETAS